MTITDTLTYQQKQELLAYLSGFLTPRRWELFREKIKFRTRHLTIVLENVFQPHNISAVLRSCECFGIQDIHIIENMNTYKVNPDIALGASNWLTIHRHNTGDHTTRETLEKLKLQGYTLVTATPHKNDHSIENLPIDDKLALIFGTELGGLSQEALKLADTFVKIPMVGFTESLNISVSAAICVYTLGNRLRNSNIVWQLNQHEELDILLDWVFRSIKHSAELTQRYLSENYK